MKWTHQMSVIFFAALIILSGCTPSETEKISPSVRTPINEENAELLEKLHAKIEALNIKLKELDERVQNLMN
ncbi:hypothetical protein NDS46_30565 (plasmid) [Paenibacillus thiaminolyticus]|uniref:hypothetical protein n=1 Tax=Paenibacillus thiaminolyticus TaxID=49283 RepID=UPI002330671D|nr:hypothetical protein [Paenibacillus thiaminolyticus]WCF11693.1 hypothetical protein NDS46_30565 [Paenibacillus thiaminolyticus]